MANCHCTTRSSKLPSKLSLPVNKIALLQKSVRLRSMQPAKKKLQASTFLADRERHKKNNFDALTSTRQFPDSKCQELFEKKNWKRKKRGRWTHVGRKDVVADGDQVPGGLPPPGHVPHPRLSRALDWRPDLCHLQPARGELDPTFWRKRAEIKRLLLM